MSLTISMSNSNYNTTQAMKGTLQTSQTKETEQSAQEALTAAQSTQQTEQSTEAKKVANPSPSSVQASMSSQSSSQYTATEIALYDTNGDGVISATEALAMEEDTDTTETNTLNSQLLEKVLSTYSNTNAEQLNSLDISA